METGNVRDTKARSINKCLMLMQNVSYDQLSLPKLTLLVLHTSALSATGKWLSGHDEWQSTCCTSAPVHLPKVQYLIFEKDLAAVVCTSI